MTFTARSLISKIFYEVTIAAIRRVDNVVHGQITELHVQTIKITAETKIAVLAALYAYALAPEILVTIRKHDDNPRVIALIIESWPPDEDGKFTIGLLFTHLTILWRAWALYEIAAGRGLHKNSEEYAAKLGIKIIPARLLDVAVVTHPFESVSPSGAVTVSWAPLRGPTSSASTTERCRPFSNRVTGR
jgi:hypothetical protein